MSSQQVSSPPIWRSRSPDEIVWAIFGNDYVAYHRPSGKTHFLNSASQQLICDILTEPTALSVIADEFASDVTDSHADTYLEHMKAMLDRLEHLGLVERV